MNCLTAYVETASRGRDDKLGDWYYVASVEFYKDWPVMEALRKVATPALPEPVDSKIRREARDTTCYHVTGRQFLDLDVREVRDAPASKSPQHEALLAFIRILHTRNREVRIVCTEW